MASTYQMHKRNWSLHERLSLRRHLQRIRTSTILSPTHLNIKEAGMMWRRFALKSKSKTKLSTDDLNPIAPIQEDLDVVAQSSARAGDAESEAVGGESHLTKPNPQGRPTTPGTGPSSSSRKRSSTEPQKPSNASADTAAPSKSPARTLTELEYCTTPPPSARKVAASQKLEAQLGREDAWILLMQMKRKREGVSLSELVGNMLIDLEKHHYPSDASYEERPCAGISVRQEAILEEAGKLVKMWDSTKLMEYVEKGKMVEAKRRSGSGRKNYVTIQNG